MTKNSASTLAMSRLGFLSLVTKQNLIISVSFIKLYQFMLLMLQIYQEKGNFFVLCTEVTKHHANVINDIVIYSAEL